VVVFTQQSLNEEKQKKVTVEQDPILNWSLNESYGRKNITSTPKAVYTVRMFSLIQTQSQWAQLYLAVRYLATKLTAPYVDPLEISSALGLTYRC